MFLYYSQIQLLNNLGPPLPFFFFSKCGDQAELQSSQFTPPQPPNFFFTTELCCWNMYTMWFFLLKSARAFMKRNMGAHVSLKALFIVQP